LYPSAENYTVPKLYQAAVHAIPAFRDFLDEKWRGPPLTLGILGGYLSILIQEQSLYSLTKANCFWFSQHLMHVIGLRHYSFPFIATSIPNHKFLFPRAQVNPDALSFKEDPRVLETLARCELHDPSSIGLLFRLLRYEEWRHGILMFRRLILMRLATLPIVYVATGFGMYFYFTITGKVQDSRSWLVWYILPPFLVLGGGVLGFVWVFHQSRPMVERLANQGIRSDTARLVEIFGEHHNIIPRTTSFILDRPHQNAPTTRTLGAESSSRRRFRSCSSVVGR
jgi:hypothetical protein